MSKQTAVEWMVEQVELISNNKNVSKEEMVKLYDEVIEQSKKMEREQIVEAYEQGVDDEYEHHINGYLRIEPSIYYSETYKSDEVEEYTGPSTCPKCESYDWSYWSSLDKMKCSDCGYTGD